MAEQLRQVAEWCEANDIEADSYGEGEHLQQFEARIADLLGYPAARFMPSGTMAQQIAARVWCERAAVNRIAMHPTCHLELHEQHGYAALHGLQAELVGDAQRPLTAADLDSIVESVAVIIVELPTRENGGQLAPWDELVALSESAHERGIAVHLDGARLWEAAAGYERSLDDICELFDSTYVSFYKGIGALPGSVLAGPEHLIEEATRWQRRQGGNLYTTVANWASANMRLDEQIANMSRYLDKARDLAAALADIDGITINPAVPQVNMFHAFLTGDCETLLLRRDQIAASDGIWLFGSLQPTDVPNVSKFELTVGDASTELAIAEVTAAFERLLTDSAVESV